MKMSRPVAANTGARVVFVATEGFGKTSCGALADKPVILMTPDELGYLTLFSHGLVPECPVFQPKTWPEVLASIESVARDPEDRKTLVLDAMVGLESLCARWVCQENFAGDWGEKGFQAWGRGTAIVAREFPSILPRLTACARKGLNVLVLGHAKVQTFKNPDGPDFDRYECNVAKDVWGRTKAWAEAVYFGNFQPIIDQNRPDSNIAKAKGKAISQQRLLRCQYSAMADAKNQYGNQPEYTMPDDPQKFADAFWQLTKKKESAQ